MSGSSVRAAGEMHDVAGPSGSMAHRSVASLLGRKKTAPAAAKSSTESGRGVERKDVKSGEQSGSVGKGKPVKAAVKKLMLNTKGKKLCCY